MALQIRRRPSPLRLLAVLALAAAGCAALRGGSQAFSLLTAPRPTLERIIGEKRLGAAEAALLEAEPVRNLTLQNASSSQAVPEQWDTCFVDVKADGQGGQAVLEEWFVRGEPENVDSFRSWRKGAMAGEASIRCVEAMQLDDILCLECFSSSGPAAPEPGAPTQLVSSFVDLQQCLRSTGGMGFCKNGQISL